MDVPEPVHVVCSVIRLKIVREGKAIAQDITV
jgi:hypothetical protein